MLGCLERGGGGQSLRGIPRVCSVVGEELSKAAAATIFALIRFHGTPWTEAYELNLLVAIGCVNPLA